MARPPDIDDYERSIAMVSEAESNAVQPAVAKGRQPKGRQPKGRQQGIPPVGPAGGRGVEHGRVEQAPCGRRRKRAIGTDQARSPSRARAGAAAAARSEQANATQACERSQAAERSQAEQTCNAASAAGAAVTLREEPKARPRRA
jgi:hypothetical protein